MRNSLIAILICLAAAPAAAQDTLTLDAAIVLGLKNNYDIRMARNDQRIADNTGDRALTAFLPRLDVSGGYTSSDLDVETKNPATNSNTQTRDWDADITLNWTLFDGFAMFANRARYAALARQGESLARNQVELSVVAISEAYFDLVQQQQLLDVARETQDISRTRLEREEVRRDLGGASSTDLLNAQVAFNADQSALLEQELQVEIARNRLNVLLGQDPTTDITVSERFAIPNLPLSADDVVTSAIENNAFLQASEAAQRAAERDVAAVRATFLPRVSAFAGYGVTDRATNSDVGMDNISDTDSDISSGRIGLSLSLNIFNGMADKISLSNARLAARNQTLAHNDTRNRLIGTVRETHDRFLKRMQIVDLELQNVEAAERNLDIEQEAYTLGNATSLDYRDAQLTLAQRRVSLIRARYQARLARIGLDQLMGMLSIQ